MTKTCTVTAKVCVNDVQVESKTWYALDVMKTAYTRGWCTRQFNKRIRAGTSVLVTWEARYDDGHHTRLTGRLVFSGKIVIRRGIFED